MTGLRSESTDTAGPPLLERMALPLRTASPDAWLEAVHSDFDSFLQDHAAAEKKAAGMAISMLSHYPDRPELVEAMADLAVEEMSHYREVVKWIHQRGCFTAADRKDDYMNGLRGHCRRGSEAFMLDRLLIAAVIEARGAERFALIAHSLPLSPLGTFYKAIARSEQRHYTLFLELASRYFPAGTQESRWSALLDIEADILRSLVPRAALH